MHELDSGSLAITQVAAVRSSISSSVQNALCNRHRICSSLATWRCKRSWNTYTNASMPRNRSTRHVEYMVLLCVQQRAAQRPALPAHPPPSRRQHLPACNCFLLPARRIFATHSADVSHCKTLTSRI